MSALLKFPGPRVRQAPRLAHDVRVALNELRFHAKTCRASAFLDIYEACRMLDPHAADAHETRQITLLRVLGQALDQTPVLYRPGEDALSFDEAWLVALLEAARRKDDDSFAFLLARRVAHSKRRIVGSLIASMV